MTDIASQIKTAGDINLFRDKLKTANDNHQRALKLVESLMKTIEEKNSDIDELNKKISDSEDRFKKLKAENDALRE